MTEAGANHRRDLFEGKATRVRISEIERASRTPSKGIEQEVGVVGIGTGGDDEGLPALVV